MVFYWDNIQYNFLNLPTQVTINGQNITYVYDAAGTKPFEGEIVYSNTYKSKNTQYTVD